ncbi:MAG: cysteine peptidase family C39 domain-containing protein [Bacteroides sp.]|nr:cysteine peptidase family C39 domain-containing protein [Bacteroides sp.]
MKRKDNTFIAFLSYLGVKHTTQFTNKLYNEHPEKNSLFGLSKMLNEYHITNRAIKIENTPQNITSLPTPFVAYLGSEFAVVCQTSTDNIQYIRKNKKISQSPDQFCSMWSGIVLMAEPDENSIEPDYTSHRQKEFIDIGKKVIFISSLLFLSFTLLIRNKEWTRSITYWAQLLMNMTGVYISWLLVLKQIHIHDPQGDRLCSVFGQKGCNEIVDLDVAKPGGIVGWSEIGLGYFVTNLLVSLCFPSLIPYTVVLNYFCLPYTFWSIWYQKYKARQWCVLCLIIQMLLWGLFFCKSTFVSANISGMEYTGWSDYMSALSDYHPVYQPIYRHNRRKQQGITDDV